MRVPAKVNSLSALPLSLPPSRRRPVAQLTLTLWASTGVIVINGERAEYEVHKSRNDVVDDRGR